jgi:hypothetical protein
VSNFVNQLVIRIFVVVNRRDDGGEKNSSLNVISSNGSSGGLFRKGSSVALGMVKLKLLKLLLLKQQDKLTNMSSKSCTIDIGSKTIAWQSSGICF